MKINRITLLFAALVFAMSASLYSYSNMNDLDGVQDGVSVFGDAPVMSAPSSAPPPTVPWEGPGALCPYIPSSWTTIRSWMSC